MVGQRLLKFIWDILVEFSSMVHFLIFCFLDFIHSTLVSDRQAILSLFKIFLQFRILGGRYWMHWIHKWLRGHIKILSISWETNSSFLYGFKRLTLVIFLRNRLQDRPIWLIGTWRFRTPVLDSWGVCMGLIVLRIIINLIVLSEVRVLVRAHLWSKLKIIMSKYLRVYKQNFNILFCQLNLTTIIRNWMTE